MKCNLAETMAQVFEVDISEIQLDCSPDTLASWDSLAHLELVSALEQELSIRFNTREMQSMDTYTKIVAVLEAHDIVIDAELA